MAIITDQYHIPNICWHSWKPAQLPVTIDPRQKLEETTAVVGASTRQHSCWSCIIPFLCTNFTKLIETSQLCKVFNNQKACICVDQAPNHFPLPRAGMKWGGNRDPPCSVDTKPLTTRNPRKDYLTQMFISFPFLCLLRFQYNCTFNFSGMLCSLHVWHVQYQILYVTKHLSYI